MRPIVLYSSQSGNTEKVAKFIAEVLQCPALLLGAVSDQDASSTINRWDDFSPLLLGSGVYAGHLAPNVKRFVTQVLPKMKPKTVGFFCTWAGLGATARDAVRDLKVLVERSGHNVVPKSFACYGQTLWVGHSNHPTQEDLTKAKAWGEYVISCCPNEN